MSGLSRRLPARWVVVPLLVVAVLVWAAVAVIPEGGRLSVSVLDVGEGDAILVTCPAGQHILIDGGPSPERVCLELGKALPFWERTIELVILTHPHSDHVTGLVEVPRRYQVGRVLYPEDIDYESTAYSEWLDVVEESWSAAEQEITTPVAIARHWEGDTSTARRIVVSAEASFDPAGRDLSYHLTVIRGDPAAVRITPQDGPGSIAEIEFDWHDEETLYIEGADRTSTLAVVGVFVHNGVYFSAPAFVTSSTMEL